MGGGGGGEAKITCDPKSKVPYGQNRGPAYKLYRNMDPIPQSSTVEPRYKEVGYNKTLL